VRRDTPADRKNFATHGYGQFALFLPEAPDELIGFAGLRPFGEPEQVEVLYALLPAHWRRGLASEAARAVLRFGFELSCARSSVTTWAGVSRRAGVPAAPRSTARSLPAPG
jgi:RimJ/RimL family protein N-acetyltransferase